MIQVTCPNCSRVGNLKLSYPPGTTLRCPGCGERFAVPVPEPEEILDLEADEAEIAPAPLVASGIDLAAGGQAQSPSSVFVASDAPSSSSNPGRSAPTGSPTRPRPTPVEPWFYGWIDGAAGFIWNAGLVLIGLAILVVVLPFVLFLAQGADVGLAWLGIGAYAVVVAIIALVPMALLSTLLRLAVDVARNIREIRYQHLTV